MSNTVIKVENLSKQYRLGTIGTGTIRSDFQKFWANIRGKEDPNLMIGQNNNISYKNGDGSNNDYIWALKDINFEVQQSEVLGIIGNNGAGKSTLLKILSQVTSPTTGRVKIKGRIASLLEVGTGFHPDLTGKENIFLNGAILGMTKSEIRKKFDEIVDFAEVERYTDTPVKRYSSGMYVRLAFAVAAHLEPDILIVDEVLAVGDAVFQKKALGKIENVSKNEGRTVLFVSHNMSSIQNLCNKCIVLKDGEISFNKSKPSDAIDYYVNDRVLITKTNLDLRKDRTGEGRIKIIDLKFLNANYNEIEDLITGQKIIFAIHYTISENTFYSNVGVALSITRSDGFLITVLSNEIANKPFDFIKYSGIMYCEITKFPLMAGMYYVNIMINRNEIIEDWITEAKFFNVINGDFFGNGKMIENSHRSILIEQKWILLKKIIQNETFY